MSTVEPDMTGSQMGSRGDKVERDSGLVVLIATGVLVFVAVALAVVAFVVHRDASDMQAAADRTGRVTRGHVAARVNSSHDLAALHASVDRTYTALGALMAGYQAQLASQNHAIEVANNAAASYNAGQANIADALNPEAQAAVADAEAKVAAVRAALVQVKQAFAALRQVSG